MIGWLIAAAVLAVISAFPIYAYFYYDGEFKIAVRVFGIKFGIPLDNKKKKKSPKKEKKNRQRNSVSKPKNVKTDAEKLLSQLKTVADIAVSVKKRLLSKFRIRRFTVHIAVGSDDPCSTALLFGGISAAVFTAVAAVDCLVPADKHDISVTADYNSDSATVFADIVLRIFLPMLIVGLILTLVDVTIKIYSAKEN